MLTNFSSAVCVDTVSGSASGVLTTSTSAGGNLGLARAAHAPQLFLELGPSRRVQVRVLAVPLASESYIQVFANLNHASASGTSQLEWPASAAACFVCETQVRGVILHLDKQPSYELGALALEMCQCTAMIDRPTASGTSLALTYHGVDSDTTSYPLPERLPEEVKVLLRSLVHPDPGEFCI